MKRLLHLAFLILVPVLLFGQNRIKVSPCEISPSEFRAKYKRYYENPESYSFAIIIGKTPVNPTTCNSIDFAEELLNFPNLKAINFNYCNNLEQLPEELKQLKKLQYLNFQESALDLSKHVAFLQQLDSLKGISALYSRTHSLDKDYLQFLSQMTNLRFRVHNFIRNVNDIELELQQLTDALSKVKGPTHLTLELQVLSEDYLKNLDKLKHFEEINLMGGFKNDTYQKYTELYPNLRLKGDGYDKEITYPVTREDAVAAQKFKLDQEKKRKMEAARKRKLEVERERQKAMTQGRAEKGNLKGNPFGNLNNQQKTGTGKPTSQGSGKGDPLAGVSNSNSTEGKTDDLITLTGIRKVNGLGLRNRRMTKEPYIFIRYHHVIQNKIRVNICVNAEGKVIKAEAQRGALPKDDPVYQQLEDISKQHEFVKSDLESDCGYILYEFVKTFR